ncbi:MAG: peptidylprolyl isomerase [Clostridia bacterium]
MKRNKIRKGILVCLSLCLSLYFTGCVDHSNKNPIVTVTVDSENQNADENGKPLGGVFQIELYPEKAPNSVAYFIDLAMNKKYDNFSVSKVFAGNIVQFGDPWMSKQIHTEIEGEFRENGYEGNDLVFKRGTVGLDLFVKDDYNSASGDFFILLSDEAGKNYSGKYAGIGEVVSGLELLDQISSIKSYPDYEPVYSIRTATTTVDLKGISYEQPITRERRTYPGTNTD